MMEGDAPEKKKHHRQKRVCAQIRDQMEFYFSDSNLHKDRMLKQLIEANDDGYVPLEVFGNFNKIKSITDDLALLAKALSTSKILKCSPDGSKVKRTTPIQEPKNVDERTIYIECLPPHADHDWIRQMFSEYGRVVYVSLPKYRSSGDHKGFAFVEYETTESAQAACQRVNNPVAEGGDRAGRFPKANKQMKQLQKQLSQSKGQDVPQEAVETSVPNVPTKKARKRKSEASESSTEGSEDIVASKVAKLDDKPEKSTPKVFPGSGKENRKRPKDSGDEDEEEVKQPKKTKENIEQKACSSEEKESESEQEKELPEKEKKCETKERRDSLLKRKIEKTEEEDGEPKEAKRVRINETVEVKESHSDTGKKRRRKKKKKEKEKDTATDVPNLKVIPKLEWMKLKQEYLTLQKKNMKDLKKQLSYKKQQQIIREKTVQKQTPVSKKEPEMPRKTMEYQADVIVKVNMSQPYNRKDLKTKLSSYAEIAYIDMDDGDQEGYVRCPDQGNAQTLSQLTLDGLEAQLLQGEEEKQYWGKIFADRDRKLNSKSRTKKRGAQKVVERAERTDLPSPEKKKHVIFDD